MKWEGFILWCCLRFVTGTVTLDKIKDGWDDYFGVGVYLNETNPLQSVPLPIIELNVTAKISGNIASNEYKFTYANPSPDKALNIKFKFPIDVDTAIYELVAEYNDGQKFEAKIKDRITARREYETAIDEGRSTVLAEQDKEMHDILRINLGILSPDSKCTITMKTAEFLPMIGNNLKYKLPTSMFHRYGRLTPKRTTIRKIASDFGFRRDFYVKPKFDLQIKVANNTDVDANKFKAPGHKAAMTYSSTSDSSLYISLKTSKVFLKDKDVIVYIPLRTETTEIAVTQGAASVYSHFVKPGVLKSVETKKSKKAKQEYILIVDNSGSMRGDRVDNAKLAVQQIINSLPVGCHFDVVKYGSAATGAYNKTVPFTTKSKKTALKFSKEMDADMDGTEILGALRHAAGYKRPHGVATERQVFIITDGDVQNQDEVFEFIRKRTKSMRVFAIGIGAGASSALVKGMAREGNGYAAFITDSLDKEQKQFINEKSLTSTVIGGIMAASRSYITDITLNGEPYPTYVSEVITDSRFINIYVDATLKVAVLNYNIVGISNNKKEKKIEFKKPSDAQLHAGAIEALFGKRKIQESFRTFLTTSWDAQEEAKTKTIKLSEDLNVLCPLTAFIGSVRDTDDKIVKENIIDVSVSAEIQSPSLGRRFGSRTGASMMAMSVPMGLPSAPLPKSLGRSYAKLSSSGSRGGSSRATTAPPPPTYQDITNEQKNNGRWKYSYAVKSGTLTTSMFNDIKKKCNRAKVLRSMNAAAKKEQKKRCKSDVSTAVAILELFGKYGDRLSEWSFSARRGVKAMRFKDKKWLLDVVRKEQKFMSVQVFDVLNV